MLNPEIPVLFVLCRIIFCGAHSVHFHRALFDCTPTRNRDLRSQPHTKKACTRFAHPTLLLDGFLLEGTMATTTLKQQAWQSGLFLPDETAQWNETDWPPLEGGWRFQHATVVLNHHHHPRDHTNTNRENDTHINSARQTVVVLGGRQHDQGSVGPVNSVLVLNLAESNKQWREGPPMSKKCDGRAAVVCNGAVYVMGGYSIIDDEYMDCIERIDANDLLLQSSFTTSSTYESHWTTLNCRLSTGRYGCCAVAVHNRYIVVMGGKNMATLSSVEIIDTTSHTVTAGPSLAVPRRWCVSAVVGHRIFVVGGDNNQDILGTVEYLNFTAPPSENEETKVETAATVTFSSSSWTTHSDLVLSRPQCSCTVVAVGSCLVVAGGHCRTVEVLDTNRNRVWNLPSLENGRTGCKMVTVTNQVAIIGGYENSTCLTLPLMDKNSLCFQRLCGQPPNGWN